MTPANIAVILYVLYFILKFLIKCLQGIRHQSRGECHSEKGMPSPLCTGDTGALVVKAHWALVTAL